MDRVITWTPKAKAVLTAASDLFYENGIHAVGVEAIAERAGVTKKTLYDRFGSKEQIVVAYLADRDVRWRAHLGTCLERCGPSPTHRLTAIFDASASWSAAHGRRGCSMINAHAEISAAHPAYAIIIGQKRWMLDLFTQVAIDAAAADPTGLGEELFMLHEGALVSGGMNLIGHSFARAAATAASLIGTSR